MVQSEELALGYRPRVTGRTLRCIEQEDAREYEKANPLRGGGR